jgi:FkbM family methyltransferase
LKYHIIESSFNSMPDGSDILIIRDSPLYRLVRTLESGVYRHLLMSSILNEYTDVASFPLHIPHDLDPELNPRVTCSFLNSDGQYVEVPGGLDFGEGSGGEPNKFAAQAFRELHRDKSNVKVEELAIWKQSGEELEMMVSPENTLISSIEGSGNGYSRSQRVLTKTLSDLMQDNQLIEVDLLKIDVEGSEYAIFESLTPDFLKRFN